MNNDLQQFTRDIQHTLEQFQEQANTLETENHLLRESVATLNRANKQLMDQHDTDSVTITSLRDSNVQRARTLEELRTEATTYREQWQYEAKKHDDTKQILDRWYDQTSQLDGKLKRLTAELETANALIVSWAQRYDALKVQHDQFSNEAQAAQMHIAKLEGELRALKQYQEDYEHSLVSYAVRHTMYEYGTVPPEEQAERLIRDVLAERETVRTLLAARGPR